MNRSIFKGQPEKTPERVSLAGCVLAAHPTVLDPLHAKSVCLIVEHSQASTVGVVLNRPMLIDPDPFWKSLFQGEPENRPTEANGHFHFGGPQNGPILAIHSDSSLAEGGNTQGVYLSAQVETLQKLALLGPEHLRWFIGNDTWAPSELERQIVDGDWYVIPALPPIVFAEESTMWHQAMDWVAQSVFESFPGVSLSPNAPLLN